MVCFLILPATISSLQAAERPNIVFIYTDDQATWSLGYAGNEQAQTPNLDRLCREGAHFTNAFVTTWNEDFYGEYSQHHEGTQRADGCLSRPTSDGRTVTFVPTLAVKLG